MDQQTQVRVAPIMGAHPRQVGQLFIEAGLADSTGHARHMMQQGGLDIDGQTVTHFATAVTPCTGMMLRRGKKHVARLDVRG